MEQEATYVGIDVAKAQVDVAVRPTDDRWEVPNDDAGIRQLMSRLKALEPTLVLLEASGGLELPLVAVLAAEAAPVVVVNPPPSAGLRQSHREAGQDRRSGCSGSGALRRSGPTSRAPPAGRRGPVPQFSGRPQTPGRDHAGV